MSLKYKKASMVFSLVNWQYRVTVFPLESRNSSITAISIHVRSHALVQVSSLEQRYGGRRAGTEEAKPGKGRKRAKMDDYDIDDAEFQRIQAEMEGRRSKC